MMLLPPVIFTVNCPSLSDSGWFEIQELHVDVLLFAVTMPVLGS